MRTNVEKLISTWN